MNYIKLNNWSKLYSVYAMELADISFPRSGSIGIFLVDDDFIPRIKAIKNIFRGL